MNRILNRRHASRAGSILIGLILTSIGCGSPENTSSPDAVPDLAYRPDLPLLQLPPVDFGTICPSAKEDLSPVALDSLLPASEFLVHLQGRRPPGKVHFPAIFAVQIRRADGKLVHIASCTLEPRGNLDQEVVTYEGICPRPAVRGPCIVELRVIGKTHFLRATEVR
jgi:hypothetical protein